MRFTHRPGMSRSAGTAFFIAAIGFADTLRIAPGYALRAYAGHEPFRRNGYFLSQLSALPIRCALRPAMRFAHTPGMSRSAGTALFLGAARIGSADSAAARAVCPKRRARRPGTGRAHAQNY